MKNLNLLNKYRFYSNHYRWLGDETCGAFAIPSCIDRADLTVVASSGAGWDHVSVSRRNRAPNWPEMSQIHRLFFGDDEACMQLHVPAADHVNDHPHCLHIWRPHDVSIPLPPKWMVGGVPAEEAERLAREYIGASQ